MEGFASTITEYLIWLVLELFWLVRGLDLMAPGWYSLVIESSVKVFGIAFLFVPLQLGVSEGAYSTIFEVMGLRPPASRWPSCVALVCSRSQVRG